jgi:putative oxidoreductase
MGKESRMRRRLRLPLVSGPAQYGAALLAIRLVMGPMLAYHGWRKLDAGVGRFVATVARDGFPLPELLARATIVIELVGGICIALGLLSRLWAALITTQFLWIVAQVKWDIGVLGPPGRGGGFELDLLYAVTSVAVLLAGPGRWAMDHLIGLETDHSQEAADSRRRRPVRAEA